MPRDNNLEIAIENIVAETLAERVATSYLELLAMLSLAATELRARALEIARAEDPKALAPGAAHMDVLPAAPKHRHDFPTVAEGARPGESVLCRSCGAVKKANGRPRAVAPAAPQGGGSSS